MKDKYNPEKSWINDNLFEYNSDSHQIKLQQQPGAITGIPNPPRPIPPGP